jgi:uroporphyrinogen-III synthase
MTLAGLHVLNTRPVHQAAPLTRQLQEAGARVSELPLIDIVPLPPTPTQQRLLLDLDRYDGVFFISANAVRYGLDAVAGCWPQWPHRLPAYAVGERSAALLRDAGLSVQVPAQPDSEGLLALPALQQVPGQRFLLIRGEGGRELLADTLRARGAVLDVLELYRRELPPAATAQWQALQQSGMPQVVVLTSPVALRHWQQVAGAAAVMPRWLVVSPRMRRQAEAAGASVIEAAAADAASLLHALRGAA